MIAFETRKKVHSAKMSSAWINIDSGKGSLPWIRQQSENAQVSGPCACDP